MNYILYGSQTSPFVRRIRMLMEDIPFELEELNIFDAPDAIKLNKVNPINQLPVLLAGDQPIWDSRQIFNYLNSHHKLQSIDLNEENLLTAMEGAMTAGVNLLLMKRSGIDTDEQFMFVTRLKERIESVLDFLGHYIQSKGVDVWNFQAMTLFSFIDWAKYRNIINIDLRPECQKFLDAHAERNIVKLTAIPKV